ncbi:MAG: hypothetical protein RQ826_05250 [Xanthomonadales bacterium]|nr:hypothetical protein [Xanthomonadales bacterium]
MTLRMSHFSRQIALLALLGLGISPAALPQASGDASSRQVEESEEAYRRRMELEDARSREAGFADTTRSQKAEEEKIDNLPQASRDNIRDQLVDIIMENGEWEPRDALADYPYEPSKAAQSDSELAKQEQEAWDEQIEKYHQREAQAFGATRPSPGGPPGKEGAQGDEGGSPEQSRAAGSAGSQSSGAAGAAAGFQPYDPGGRSSDDELSTAGVSESALDFLRRGRAGGQAAADETEPAAALPEPLDPAAGASDEQTATPPADIAAATKAPDGSLPIEDLGRLRGAQEPVSSNFEQADATAGQIQSETPEPAQDSADAATQAGEEDSSRQTEAQESSVEIDLETPGIIPIRDLEKLEGTAGEDG